MKQSKNSFRYLLVSSFALMLFLASIMLSACLDFGEDKDDSDDDDDDDEEEGASEEDIEDACNILVDLEEYDSDEDQDCLDDLADEDACVVECILDNEETAADCLDNDSEIYKDACESDSDGDSLTSYEKCLAYCEKSAECATVPETGEPDTVAGFYVEPVEDGDTESAVDGDEDVSVCGNFCDSITEDMMPNYLPIFACTENEYCEDFNYCVMNGGVQSDGDEYVDGDYSTDGDYYTDGDVSEYCEMICSEEGIGLSCGTGSMTCNNSYDGSGRVSYFSCTYSNGKYFSCSVSYDSMGEPYGSCNGEGSSCYF